MAEPASIAANEKPEGKFSFVDVPRALWYFLDTERWTYVGFLLLLLVTLAFPLVPPYMVGLMANFLIDYVKAPPGAAQSISPLLWMAGILGTAHATVSLVRLSSKRILGRISLNARYRAKVWGFERLLDSSLAWHQQENTGNKAQRILTGAEAVREWTGDVLNNFFPAIVVFIGSLVACLMLHPAFILFFVYYLGVLAGTEFYFDYRIARLSDRINKSMENASGSFVESASNILAVKAMGAADGLTGNIARREELARELSYERLRLGNSKWMCFQIHNAICWTAYLIVIGWMVMQGSLATGFFLTYAVYFDKLRDSSVEFTDRFQLLIERKSNLARMMPLFWQDNALSKGDKPFPTDWRSIEVSEAVFRYGDRPAVGPLTLSVARGEIIGIAGHSGSGKSTLIKLLLGLYHVEQGALRIGGIPVSEIRHEELTGSVAVVLQETEMFNFSLKDNITMTRDVAPELLQRACEVACLGDLIARLPDGLETVIGERGYTLSGGERQRVGIARAVCRNAPLLLLDEGTSALDSTTEQKVMDGLMGEFGNGRTMIIVAHRISTLREADRIFVFEKGMLVEQGAFRELADNPATHFGAMYAIQQS